jgi:hypothetical protein
MNAIREMLDVLDIPASPPGLVSNRERLREWARRLDRSKQGSFRAALLQAFGGRCCISGYDAPDALEAAHIVGVAEGGTDAPENGLLLRVDLHRLFDLGLLQIRGAPLKVWIAPALRSSAYGVLHAGRLQATLGPARLRALRGRAAATRLL